MTTSQQNMILVGWDSSERARDALALAGVLAREQELGIRLAHVYETYPAYPPYTDLTESAREVGQKLLDAAPLESLEGIETERVLVTAHSPSAGLHRLAEGTDVAMVVIGSTRSGAIGRALAGTIATHLLHGAPCAVAIAPAGYVQRSRPTVETVAVAYDGSPEARAAVEEATRLAQSAAGKLRIISVVEPASYGWAGAAMVPPVDLLDAEERLRRHDLEEIIATRPPDVDCEDVLCQGRAANVISDQAADADLLVMGSRGYGPVRSVLLGSVSSHVVRSARCPVLVLPRTAITDSDAERAEQPAVAV